MNKKKKGVLYDTIECKDKEDWLEARKSFLTASEFVLALGRTHFGRTQIDLWEEKTGLKTPTDISDKPAVKRGIEREPIIREQFARENPWFKVEYNQFNLYVSNETGYDMLACTLDGELTVLNSANPYHLTQGARGTLEIKSVAYRDEKELDAWDSGIAPDGYIGQSHLQMFVRRDYFHILLPEFCYVGDDTEKKKKPYTIGFPILTVLTPELRETIYSEAYAAREWWNEYVVTKTCPPTEIASTSSTAPTEVAVIEADAEVGRFFENFDTVKASIERMVEPYRNVVFTPELARDAKAIHAELNGYIKDITTKKSAVKKKYEEPLKAFVKKADELVAVIDDVRIPIKAQIDLFEDQRKEEKRRELLSEIEKITAEAFANKSEDRAFFESCGGVVFDERWLNKGTSKDAVRNAVEDQLLAFNNDMFLLTQYATDDELRTLLLAEYSRTRNVPQALEARARLLAARDQAARVKMLEKERKKVQEEKNPLTIDTRKEVITENDIPNTEYKEQVITFTFRASHPSKEAWKGLIQYMKDNGFKYEKLN